MFNRTKLEVVLSSLSLAVRAGDTTQCTRCAVGKFKSQEMFLNKTRDGTLGDLENQGQGMVPHTKKGRFPPAPLPQQRHTR